MSRTRYDDQLEAAIDAVRILSPSRFSWRGTPVPPRGARTKRRLDGSPDRSRLRDRLKTVLYDAFYCQGGCVESAANRSTTGESDPAFVAALASRNRGAGGWEPGWSVRHTTPAHLVIERNGLTLRATLDECRSPSESAADEAVDEMVALRYPNDRCHVLPGFYVALGDEPRPRDQPLVRAYWNVTCPGALILMEELTGQLNRAGLPFHLKVVDHPSRFDRCDSSVLYFPAADAHRTLAILANTHRRVASHLRSRIPALTRRLADGLALAEDPGGGESFGTHRCGLVAEGLLRAHDGHARRLTDRLQIVKKCFEDGGINPSTPYQRSLEIDRLVARRFSASKLTTHGTTPTRSDASFLDTATWIGQRLCEAAIWDGDACNWLGPGDDPGGTPRTYGSLGPDLYRGTSGIGWFLAELAALSADDRTAATATGALRYALDAAARLDGSPDLGLFTGLVGIAVASTRVSALLDDDRLRLAAVQQIDERLGIIADHDDPGFDLISGRAGLIVGLLALHHAWRADHLLDLAADLGTALVACANRTGCGASWSAPNIPSNADLTGLAHGAAGAAWALGELGVATRRPELLDCARQAIAYERNLFDPVGRNWPDLRRHRPAESGTARYPTLWCHGATGIGLTRLRLTELLADPALATEATNAMATVRSAVERSLAGTEPSLCLCHGLTGNADALLQTASATDEVIPANIELARAVGRAMGRRFQPGKDPAFDELPYGLMTGIAGIGLFHLRLADPTIPSPLLLRSHDLADPRGADRS